MAKRATQKDVARLAGVSQAAVSIVLTGAGTGSIPAETWQRITDAARKLGYAPNRFAQGLRTRRAMTVAFVVPDITNPFYPMLMRGIQTVTQEHSYDVIAISTDGVAEGERRFLDWTRQGRVDGVIGVFFTLSARDFRPLLDAGIPVVRIEAQKKCGGDIPLDDIYVDSYAAARSLTEYLIARGHTRVAMIAGRGGPQNARLEGYNAALREVGRAPYVVIDDVFNEEGGFRAAQAALDSGYGPTAIFAANDLMAIGAMRGLRERGISIPREIAVAGFDDILAAKLVAPSLTTVTQFQGNMGIKAAQVLMDRLRGENPVRGRVFEMPFRLIMRDST
ncbi:LacI family DNA-binding transcriptional regulator [Bradyrhizobium sp. NBAIM01]|uniref:LacI family DNA-binding transcriptional regulator n=1 Tax=Bradyrhizobium sp. NBAIM01 TaxID=2793818 RepID=UPI001CD4E867|nr:LacI family DNA-binding transcriptional regulator [Bradyrhizobium sp. NBAIM01]MCA1510412.1 LacI family DNA-binding transcriptional regulator [Bradyrhizobium sp. NBAIM01]